jgi:L-arabinose isomerase
MKIYSRRDVTVNMIQIAGVGDKPRVMYDVIPGDMVTLSFIQLNLHE